MQGKAGAALYRLGRAAETRGSRGQLYAERPREHLQIQLLMKVQATRGSDRCGPRGNWAAAAGGGAGGRPAAAAVTILPPSGRPCPHGRNIRVHGQGSRKLAGVPMGALVLSSPAGGL